MKIDGTHISTLGVRIKDYNIQAPTPKTISVDTPFANGGIFLNPLGIPIFNNRTITITLDYKPKNFADIYFKYSEILTLVYKKEKQQIVFDWDSQFFYFGRCVSCEIEREYDKYATYTLTFECEPYKYDIAIAGEPWLWDPFNFLNGIIYSKPTQIVGSGTITLANRLKPVIPIFKVTQPCTIAWKGKTYKLVTGSNRIADVLLPPGTSTITVTGTTTITVSYHVGEL